MVKMITVRNAISCLYRSQSGIDGSMCAQQCDCESNLFEPVCGADDLNYFSPCRAGCTQIPLQDDEVN